MTSLHVKMTGLLDFAMRDINPSQNPESDSYNISTSSIKMHDCLMLFADVEADPARSLPFIDPSVVLIDIGTEACELDGPFELIVTGGAGADFKTGVAALAALLKKLDTGGASLFIIWFSPTIPTYRSKSLKPLFPIPGYTSNTCHPSSFATAYAVLVFPDETGPASSMTFVNCSNLPRECCRVPCDDVVDLVGEEGREASSGNSSKS